MSNPLSHEDLMNTIGTRINDILVPLLGTITLIQDNQEFPDEPTDPWIRATILHGGNFQADTGAEVKRIRRMGVIMFQLFGALNKGTKALNQLVAHIETVFRTKRVDGVVYRTPDITTVGRSGKYYQLNVSCPFWVDVF